MKQRFWFKCLNLAWCTVNKAQGTDVSGSSLKDTTREKADYLVSSKSDSSVKIYYEMRNLYLIKGRQQCFSIRNRYSYNRVITYAMVSSTVYGIK
jgi:hypothetical protein